MIRELSYVDRLASIVEEVEVTTREGSEVSGGVKAVCQLFEIIRSGGCKIMLVGNGGSAAIASHTAIDLSKNAHIPAMAFNDLAALTCLANDYGYDQVFAKQVAYHALPGDVLVAISSSGMSRNILKAADAAMEKGLRRIVTFSGFDSENYLRKCGDLNFYVPSNRYGFVELAHMVLLHEIIDELTTA